MRNARGDESQHRKSSRMWRFFLAGLVASALGAYAPAKAAPDLAPPSDEIQALGFLNRFPSIRLYISKAQSASARDPAPGNGHEAASIQALARLRELGYEGRIEVIYDPWVKQKMGFLLPGYDVDGADRQILAPNLEVTSLDEFSTRMPSPQKLSFGMTAATDAVTEDFTQKIPG